MKSVYLLQHSYDLEGVDETKIIGIYSSRQKAQDVIDSYKLIEGFKDYPDAFYIDEYKVDQDHWKEGFVKVYY